MKPIFTILILLIIFAPFIVLCQNGDVIENNTGIVINRSPNTTVNINTAKRFTEQDSIYFLNAVKYFEQEDSVKIVNVSIGQTQSCNVVLFASDLYEFFERNHFGMASGMAIRSKPHKGIQFKLEKFGNRLATLDVYVGSFSFASDTSK